MQKEYVRFGKLTAVCKAAAELGYWGELKGLTGGKVTRDRPLRERMSGTQRRRPGGGPSSCRPATGWNRSRRGAERRAGRAATRTRKAAAAGRARGPLREAESRRGRVRERRLRGRGPRPARVPAVGGGVSAGRSPPGLPSQRSPRPRAPPRTCFGCILKRPSVEDQGQRAGAVREPRAEQEQHQERGRDPRPRHGRAPAGEGAGPPAARGARDPGAPPSPRPRRLPGERPGSLCSRETRPPGPRELRALWPRVPGLLRSFEDFFFFFLFSLNSRLTAFPRCKRQTEPGMNLCSPGLHRSTWEYFRSVSAHCRLREELKFRVGNAAGIPASGRGSSGAETAGTRAPRGPQGGGPRRPRVFPRPQGEVGSFWNVLPLVPDILRDVFAKYMFESRWDVDVALRKDTLTNIKDFENGF